MTQRTDPYAEQYLEGRRCGLNGVARDMNPYFVRTEKETSPPESEEIWRSKYDIWRQGWMEGHAQFERHDARK